MKRLKIALIGQGRSGRDIHGEYFLKDEAKELFEVVAVVDKMPARREKAKKEFGCDVYEDYKELFGRTDIDFVTNASVSPNHYPITKDLMEHGFNVVTEKPFSKYAMECEDLMNTAKKHNVMLAVFQNSRFAPYYTRIKEIIESGKLGKIHHIQITFSSYSRRWDWQCSNRMYAGALLNTGPHPMDQAIDLLNVDALPNVFSVKKLINSSGDAEDFAKVALTAPARPLIEVEVSCVDGYSDCLYKIGGDRGCLKAGMSFLKWKYFDEKPLPELDLNPMTKEDGVTPAYCSETLDWHEFEEKLEGDALSVGVPKFYQNVYNHLLNGEELVVKAEQALQQIRVMELVHAQNPLPTLY